MASFFNDEYQIITTYNANTGESMSPIITPAGLVTNLAVDKNGKVFAGENTASGDEIVTYTPNGLPTTPTIPNASLGAVSANGTIYAFVGNSVVTYDPGGYPIGQPIYVDNPQAMAVDSSGDIYVGYYTLVHGDYCEVGCVAEFFQNGSMREVLQTYAIYGFSIAVGSSGQLYVGQHSPVPPWDGTSNVVYEYNSVGNLLHYTKIYPNGPFGIAVGPDGRVYAPVQEWRAPNPWITVMNSTLKAIGKIFMSGSNLINPSAIAVH